MADETTPYLAAIRAHAARVLSLLDREPYSPTFGCFDRTFWAWKFTDFPGARFQEGLCFLSFLYAQAIDDTPYFKNKKLLDWITGGFQFWARMQRTAGDFDEAYPFERSLAATAFTSFYLCEAWTFLDGELPDAVDAQFRRALTRAGDWLARNDETHGFLSNHLAAAAAALHHAHRITGHDRFKDRSEYFLDKILTHQSDEGWYEEYGGADPGYQTHGSFYLARFWQLSGDARLRDSLDRSFRFLSHFIHVDRSIGGEYTSRNTQTYYPAAFEMMSSESAAASWIAAEMRPAVSSLAAAGVGTVDIYNLFPLLNNTVFAFLGARQNSGSRLEPEDSSPDTGTIYFPKAGLLKVRRPAYDLIVGVQKGGVFKLFDRERRRLIASNSGYIGRLSDGKTFSNQWIVAGRDAEIKDDGLEVEGQFYQFSRPVMDPYRFIAFRLFSLTAGRLKGAAYWLKSLLVKVLIYRKRTLNLHFKRSIHLDDRAIEVVDRLHGDGDTIAVLEPAENFTTIHMGSSRYFVPNELNERQPDDYWRPIETGQLATGVERKIRFHLNRDDP